LPDTDYDRAEHFCRKLARSMENNALFEIMGPGPGFCFSVSAGIAEANPESRMATLVNEAEKQQNIFYECSI
jgi:phospholipid/cholesterol/gamma-HCH transport system ATP-binding protein